MIRRPPRSTRTDTLFPYTTILRANPDGSAVTLSDVARVELGAQTYLFDSELNGKPVAALAVQMTPGANALATAEAVKTRMAPLAARSEARRVGTECVRTFISRWSASP